MAEIVAQKLNAPMDLIVPRKIGSAPQPAHTHHTQQQHTTVTTPSDPTLSTRYSPPPLSFTWFSTLPLCVSATPLIRSLHWVR